jgi:ketosteroid isomerase-like protein
MPDPSLRGTVQRLYEAFRSPDPAILAEFFAEDVEMVQVGRNRLAGHFYGRQALLGHFADIGRLTEELRMEPYEILTSSDVQAAALNRMMVRIGGVVREFPVIHLFRFSSGGKVVELRSIPEDPYELDVFFGA